MIEYHSSWSVGNRPVFLESSIIVPWGSVHGSPYAFLIECTHV